MNNVLVDENKLNKIESQFQQRKADFISENTPNWRKIGNTYKSLRESLDIPINVVSSVLQVSTNRIKRFEAGKPVQDAKLIASAYNLFLEQVVNSDNNERRKIYLYF